MGLLMLITFVPFEAMAVGTAMPTAVAELDGLSLVPAGVSAPSSSPRSWGSSSAATSATAWSAGRAPVGVDVFAVGLLTAGPAGNMAIFVAGRACRASAPAP